MNKVLALSVVLSLFSVGAQAQEPPRLVAKSCRASVEWGPQAPYYVVDVVGHAFEKFAQALRDKGYKLGPEWDRETRQLADVSFVLDVEDVRYSPLGWGFNDLLAGTVRLGVSVSGELADDPRLLRLLHGERYYEVRRWTAWRIGAQGMQHRVTDILLGWAKRIPYCSVR